MNRPRKSGESYPDYKADMKAEERALREWLKGRYCWYASWGTYRRDGQRDQRRMRL